jgi:thiosulfate/3-mercaptopyruvate sulfurtransferase
MIATMRFRHISIAALVILLLTGSLLAQEVSPSDPWNKSQLITTTELAQELRENKPPLLLQVGFRSLYVQGHVPGSHYLGPTARPEGRAALRSFVQRLPRNKPIVVYCGCCPWYECPNIRPAFSELRSMGFTKVKVLYIPDNFGRDWAAKGYPVAKGE